jgi:hypothetical protein
MRSILALTASLVLATAAQAAHGPAPDVKLGPSAGEYAISLEALGAMLESDYFKAPQNTFVSGNTCRLRFDYFDRGRLSATCR